MPTPVYTFTTDWFSLTAKDNWEQLLPRIRPQKILEIGCFEGASTCHLIDTLAVSGGLEIHSVDTWGGGIEHQAGGRAQTDMQAVEQRFVHNTQAAMAAAAQPVSLQVYKQDSHSAMARLIAQGQSGSFDFVYVDGSHQAPDVLFDAVLAFKLLKVGGTLAFDDYLWTEDLLPSQTDILRCPKPGIDAFTNVYFHKLRILRMPLYQLYMEKLSD
jgi:predicted O-methyltransferase YrrM